MGKYRSSALTDEVGVEHVDQETGEIIWLTAALAEKEDARRKSLNPRRKENPNLHRAVDSPTASGRFDGHMFWTRADREFHERMLMLDLPRNPRRVLDALMVRTRFGNYVSASYAELNKLTGIAESHISAAMKVLCDSDMVVRLGRGEYMVNPLYCYMGDSDSRSSALGRYMEARRKTKKAASKRP